MRTLQAHTPYYYSSGKKDPQNIVTLVHTILALYHLLRKEHLKRLCNWVISIAYMDTTYLTQKVKSMNLKANNKW